MALSMLELNPLRRYQHREATQALQVKNCVRVIRHGCEPAPSIEQAGAGLRNGPESFAVTALGERRRIGGR